MKHRTVVILFTALIGTGLFLYYIIVQERYPAAFVGIYPISSGTLDEVYSAAVRYYQNAAKTYGGNVNELSTAAVRQEIRRAAMEELIEERIIHSELQRRLGKDLDLVVQNKLNDIVKDPSFQKAAAAVYGLAFDDFSRLFLVPQAEREILDGRLFLEKKELSGWLEAAKKKSRVTILTPGFSWNGETVELRD
ncbi:MAG: hypothetical protein HY456_00890 [Parcubacteria group bacterium]|nr:hypothetical protein [Parcubacteria group bacterium]